MLSNKRVRQGILILVDMAIVLVCTWVSILMRFNMGEVPFLYREAVVTTLPIDMVLTVVVFWIFRLYHSIWAFASLREIARFFMNIPESVSRVLRVGAFAKDGERVLCDKDN